MISVCVNVASGEQLNGFNFISSRNIIQKLSHCLSQLSRLFWKLFIQSKD